MDGRFCLADVPLAERSSPLAPKGSFESQVSRKVFESYALKISGECMSTVPVTRVRTLRRSMLVRWILAGVAQRFRFGLAVPGSGLPFHGRLGALWFAIVSRGVSARPCASGSIN
jgi:hypothetical protein